MTSGIITLTFKPSATPDEIKSLVSKFYTDNEPSISGMQYREFENDDPIAVIHKFLNETEE